MADTRPSIGEQLRQERESRNLSIEKASQDTHIRLGYLQAIEAGSLDTLPSPTQARGFLRAYAGYLGLDLEKMLAPPPVETPAPVGGDGSDLTQSPPDLTQDSESPAQIFSEIGQILARQRGLLGFTVGDVERQTHLRSHYLKSLEAGAIDELPSPVQGRGMLSNYATFLGLDPDPLLLRFAEGLQARLASSRQQGMTRPRQPGKVASPSIRRMISGDMVFGGVLIVLLTIFLIWGVGRITNLSAQEEPVLTELSIDSLLLGSPTVTEAQGTEALTPADSTVVPGAAEAAGTPETALPPAGEGAVQVYIVAHQRAWMRVLVDGEEAFSGRILPGAAVAFSGDETVEVLTGNGLALEVFYNQENLGRLGFFGEIVHRLFSVEGIITPTPTNSPTPTETPRTTVTPTPLETQPVE